MLCAVGRKKSENIKEGQILELRVMPNNGVPRIVYSIYGLRS